MPSLLRLMTGRLHCVSAVHRPLKTVRVLTAIASLLELDLCEMSTGSDRLHLIAVESRGFSPCPNKQFWAPAYMGTITFGAQPASDGSQKPTPYKGAVSLQEPGFNPPTHQSNPPFVINWALLEGHPDFVL